MTVRFGSMAGATAGAGARAQGCLRGGTHAGATPAGPETAVSHRVGRTAAAGELAGCGPRWWPGPTECCCCCSWLQQRLGQRARPAANELEGGQGRGWCSPQAGRGLHSYRWGVPPHAHRQHARPSVHLRSRQLEAFSSAESFTLGVVYASLNRTTRLVQFGADAAMQLAAMVAKVEKMVRSDPELTGYLSQ